VITACRWTLTKFDHTSTVDAEGGKVVCKPGNCPSCIVLRDSEVMNIRKLTNVVTKTEISFQVFFFPAEYKSVYQLQQKPG
jgi:hypothetical protein